MSLLRTGVNAGVILIGNELLSGKVSDLNSHFIANFLIEEAIDLDEVAIIPDNEARIIAKVIEFKARFDYVFTTGGIGPTHDDITADAIAKAFKVGRELRPEILKEMTQFYQREITKEERHMVNIPIGAALIYNAQSIAPGFRLENVFVMAGIPRIMQSMLLSLRGKLKKGKKKHSRTLKIELIESRIAPYLYRLAEEYDNRVEIGSYPFREGKAFGVRIVFSSIDLSLVNELFQKLENDLVKDFKDLKKSEEQ